MSCTWTEKITSKHIQLQPHPCIKIFPFGKEEGCRVEGQNPHQSDTEWDWLLLLLNNILSQKVCYKQYYATVYSEIMLAKLLVTYISTNQCDQRKGKQQSITFEEKYEKGYICLSTVLNSTVFRNNKKCQNLTAAIKTIKKKHNNFIVCLLPCMKVGSK